jgi:hypothetical protein
MSVEQPETGNPTKQHSYYYYYYYKESPSSAIKRSLTGQLYSWSIILMVTFTSLVVFWWSFALSIGYTLVFDTWPWAHNQCKLIFSMENPLLRCIRRIFRWVCGLPATNLIVKLLFKLYKGNPRQTATASASSATEFLVDMLYSGMALAVVVLTMIARFVIMTAWKFKANNTPASYSSAHQAPPFASDAPDRPWKSPNRQRSQQQSSQNHYETFPGRKRRSAAESHRNFSINNFFTRREE